MLERMDAVTSRIMMLNTRIRILNTNFISTQCTVSVYHHDDDDVKYLS